MDKIDLAFMLIGVVILGICSFFGYMEYQQTQFFNKKFNEFNEHRLNPLTKEQYKPLFDFTYSYPMLALFGGDVGGGNQYDGDEVMSNPARDAKTRIVDHLNLDRKKPNRHTVSSMGYTFTKRDNLNKFIELFLKTMPYGSYALPVNGTWVIFSRQTNEGLNLSIDALMMKKLS